MHRKAKSASIVSRKRCRLKRADHEVPGSSRPDDLLREEAWKAEFWDLLWGDDRGSRTMVSLSPVKTLHCEMTSISRQKGVAR